MEKKKSKKAGQKTGREKVQFTVVREFAGSQTMQEAFEQLIEKQAYEYFEKWLGRKSDKTSNRIK